MDVWVVDWGIGGRGGGEGLWAGGEGLINSGCRLSLRQLLEEEENESGHWVAGFLGVARCCQGVITTKIVALTSSNTATPNNPATT